MAHGTADYGVTAASSVRYQLFDVGELAARLGSPVTHDRRGDVVWWDDAECGVAKWDMSLIVVGAGGSVGTSTVRARNGRVSYFMSVPNGIGGGALMEHYQPLASTSRAGFESSFSKQGANPSIYWGIEHRDGTRVVFFDVKLDGSNGDLLYRNAAGAFVTLDADATLGSVGNLFHTVKLVVNPTTATYERLIANEREYDLGGVAAQVSVVGGGPYRVFRITLETIAANNLGVYIDDVIVTEGESANG